MSLALAPLANTIKSQVPDLIERTLKHDIENNLLENQIADIEVHIELVKRSIAHARFKQTQLQNTISRIQGSNNMCLAGVSGPSACEAGTQRARTVDVVEEDASFATSYISAESPVSLKTKRKGIVFSDEVRIVKKARLAQGSTQD